MSFTQSLTSFQYLSELYHRDAPDAVLMTEYPSSNSPDTRFKNTSAYIIHDPFPPPPLGLLKTLGPHHLMYGWGDKIAVTSEVAPPRALLDHWRDRFGAAGCPTWQPITDTQPYITSFPFETLDVTQQVIDPDRLYHLHSKQAIAEIDCPQADVFEDVQFPCIIKLSHGYAGLGNFFVRNAEDLRRARAQIADQWPDAPFVINALLVDIVGDYGVQFYLDKQGEMTWIGFTQQVFSDTGRWTGGVFNADQQDALYEDFARIAEPVAAYLTKNRYFGVVGFDVLQNKRGELFLVDLNPRLTGITPFLIVSRLLIADGYRHGIYAASVTLIGDLDDAIKTADTFTDTRVSILSAYKAPGSPQVTCHISISGRTLTDCEEALARLQA